MLNNLCETFSSFSLITREDKTHNKPFPSTNKIHMERAQHLTECDQIFVLTPVFTERKLICWMKSLKLLHSKHNNNNNNNYKHSDAWIYLPPYTLDVLKIVEYKFSCDMEAHVEVTTSLMFDCNTFKDKRHLLIFVAITLPSKELQFCNIFMQ